MNFLRRLLLVLPATLVVLPATASAATAPDGLLLQYELISRTLREAPRDVDGPSGMRLQLSSIGSPVVAFESGAANLVAGDTNRETDVFLAQSGSIRRVSVGPGPNGVQANAGSSLAWQSADFRVLAFTSTASNLLPGDTPDTLDLFLRIDGFQGITLERIDLRLPPDALRNEARVRGLDADRAFVVMEAPRRLADGRAVSQVWLLDIAAQANQRIGGDDVQAAYSPAISADGNFVLYHSVPAPAAGAPLAGAVDVVLYERSSGNRTVLTAGGLAPAVIDGFEPPRQQEALSLKGECAAFASNRALLPGDTNDGFDAFLYRAGATPALTALSQQHPQLAGRVREVALAADCSRVLVGSATDVYAFAVPLIDQGQRLNLDSSGQPQPLGGGFSISNLGTQASIALAGPSTLADDNGMADVVQLSATAPGPSQPLTWRAAASSSAHADSHSRPTALSDDGRWVAFDSAASNLLLADALVPHVYLRDRFSQVTARVSEFGPGQPFGCASSDLRISDNALAGAFVACLEPLAEVPAAEPRQVWRYDRPTGDRVLASATLAGDPANAAAYAPQIAASGRVIAFATRASNLTGLAQPESFARIVLRDYDEASFTTIPPVNAPLGCNEAQLERYLLAGSGRVLAFTACSDSLDGGSVNPGNDVFVWLHPQGQLQRVSGPATGAPPGSYELRGLSADGRFVLSERTAPGAPPVRSLHLHDRLAGTTRRLDTLFRDLPLRFGPGSFGTLSGDARVVAYSAQVPGGLALLDLNAQRSVVPVSLLGSNPLNAALTRPVLSDNGRKIAFASAADNLFLADGNGRFDDVVFNENLFDGAVLDVLLRDGFE